MASSARHSSLIASAYCRVCGHDTLSACVQHPRARVRHTHQRIRHARIAAPARLFQRVYNTLTRGKTHLHQCACRHDTLSACVQHPLERVGHTHQWTRHSFSTCRTHLPAERRTFISVPADTTFHQCMYNTLVGVLDTLNSGHDTPLPPRNAV